MEELIKYMVQIKTAKKDKIEELFRLKDYLISPLNTSRKSLEGKYYLNKQQDEIKGNVLVSLKMETIYWDKRGYWNRENPDRTYTITAINIHEGFHLENLRSKKSASAFILHPYMRK